jgi:hypothetical protein
MALAVARSPFPLAMTTGRTFGPASAGNAFIVANVWAATAEIPAAAVVFRKPRRLIEAVILAPFQNHRTNVRNVPDSHKD